MVLEECLLSAYFFGLVDGGRYRDNRYDNNIVGIVIVFICKLDIIVEYLENVERG